MKLVWGSRSKRIAGCGEKKPMWKSDRAENHLLANSYYLVVAKGAAGGGDWRSFSDYRYSHLDNP
ncbi:MAG: hypothetical protein ACLR8P_19605 [Clostridium fessum]